MNNENNNLNQNINNGQINSTQQQYNNVQQPTQKSKTNKFAIYSIIFSAISIVIFWWMSALGLGYGIKALKEIKKTGEKGKILAILGILIGIASITLFIVTTTGLLK